MHQNTNRTRPTHRRLGYSEGMDDVVVVITDLFFSVRIRSAAAAAGRTVRFAGTLEDLNEAPTASVALVDLDAAVDVPRAIRLLKERGTLQIVAFGPHLDTEKRKAARIAGADRVLAKSKFVTELPALMQVEGASTLSD